MSTKPGKLVPGKLTPADIHEMVVLPEPSPQDFAKAYDSYMALQAVIDQRMPDSIMKIQGKPFRKKAYWRAVARYFRLNLEPVADEFFEVGDQGQGRDGDWGYRVAYRATNQAGEFAYGDGTCMRSEKFVWDWDYTSKPKKKLGINWERTAENATHHNVRGHAHTRAINRAVSNLVGFGEVSAEEMPFSKTDPSQKGDQRPQAPQEQGPKQAPKPFKADPGWDGSKEVFFGKYSKMNPPKTWSELPSAYLNFITSKMGDPALGMAKSEIARRAGGGEKKPTSTSAYEPDEGFVEAEVTREPGEDDDLPFGEPPAGRFDDDPRLR